jgi:iron complex transport system ATP-binding protein
MRIVLDDVSAHFAPGTLTAVIGPNGAGKSTLLSTLAGLLEPDAGHVMLGDLELKSLNASRLARRRAYLPQNPRIEWPISVERLVALGLTPVLPAFGELLPESREQLERTLVSCELLELRDRAATMLSGGELARAMLGRAVVGDPEILIVDEPTAGLDPRHAIDACKRLRAHARAGRTVVVAMHDLDLAARYADHFVALREGRVAVAAPADEALNEDLLTRLYDVKVRVLREGDGTHVRFME